MLIRTRVLTVGMLLLATGACLAQGTIKDSNHNLSVTGPGPAQATAETQVCVFCHTPHGANTFPGSPLWNRSLSGETYTPFTSSSLDAESIAGTQLAQPGGSSKACLSCHDGTLALGAVSNAPGTGLGAGITMNSAGGAMPAGAGVDTGFTRNLGTDLRNDHPISVTYDATLVSADGELVSPAGAGHLGPKFEKPLLPLEATGPGGDLQVQCATCHDPHLPDFGKFLRTNRMQQNDPIGTFSEVSDQICLGCHDKKGWADSAHAISNVADEQYASVGLRDFPAGTTVAEAGCLNCHDAHTVHGARRLLREGTDSLSSPKSGGNSAIEETCFECHTDAANTVLSTTGNDVPDIETEFNLRRHMPLTSFDQPAGQEVHDIGTGQNADEGTRRGSDLIEDESLLGKGNLNNRHAECTDCHNPHRVVKNSRYDGSGSSTQATHEHSAPHSNEASGALAGAWGVEPNYGGSAFLALPSSYTIKRGDPATGGTDVVTREYQICLKCHSDYGYNDDGTYTMGGDASGRPALGDSGGSTPSGTNDMTTYTNQAMEFQAPLGDQGEPGNVNHRSWHPVIDNTARGKGARGGMDNNMFLGLWDAAVGTQTMYCSDCHGRETANGSSTPPGGRPVGAAWVGRRFPAQGRLERRHRRRSTGRPVLQMPQLRCLRRPESKRKFHQRLSDRPGQRALCTQFRRPPRCTDPLLLVSCRRAARLEEQGAFGQPQRCRARGRPAGRHDHRRRPASLYPGPLLPQFRPESTQLAAKR